MKHVTHDDLLTYGLIPEFVGRSADGRGARVAEQGHAGPHPHGAEERGARQFQRFFSLDDVELCSRTTRSRPAPTRRIRHKTGARGLRTVLEDTLLDVMYEVPSRADVEKCIVNADTIHAPPPSLA